MMLYKNTKAIVRSLDGNTNVDIIDGDWQGNIFAL